MLVKHTIVTLQEPLFGMLLLKGSQKPMRELLLSLSTSDRTCSKGRKSKKSRLGKRIFQFLVQLSSRMWCLHEAVVFRETLDICI